MSKSQTARWRDVRAKRLPNPEAVARHTARMEAEEHAYRPREIREVNEERSSS